MIMKNKKDTECMDFSVKLFRVVGCWPRWKHNHQRSEQLYFCYTTATYVVLFVYTLILAYGLTAHYKSWSSFEEAIEELVVFATGFIVLLKITLILWNQVKLQETIDYINKDLNRRELIDEEDNSVIKACIKHEKSLTKIYIFFGYSITTLYTASSIIRILGERISSDDNYTLPLRYPFHPKHFPTYHILYLHQMIVMILNGHIGTLVDTFFSCLAYYICGHFEIIKNRIAKEGGIITKHFVSYHNEIIRFSLSSNGNFSFVSYLIDVDTQESMGERHVLNMCNCEINLLAEKLESIFGSFLMFQLTTNSLLICLGLLQITQTANINLLHFIKCLIYVTIKLSQLFLYCWYGEEIKKKSSSVAIGAYSGVWHEFQDKRTTFNIRMVLFRAQKPVGVRAGAYFVLSLPTLAKVINTAYSFFTMIKSTQKSEMRNV